MSGTVGIVLQSEYGRIHADLVSLKVNDTVFGAVSAASVANGDPSVAVSSGFVLKRSQEALFRFNLG